MEVELPFKAEYAKSGRASCKGCKTKIEQGMLRIAVMVQSAFHDAKQPNWFHDHCFFMKQRPSSAGDIENFENLRFEHQELINREIAALSTVVAAGSGKGGKRSKAAAGALKDFGIEYAKSGRATCRGCEQKILKDVVRVQKTVFDSEVGMKYGGQPLWHHVECFAQLRQELGWLESGEFLPGFKSLKADDKKEVMKALPAVNAEGPKSKKPKLEQKSEKEEAEELALQKLIKKQSDRVFKFRDNVKLHMTKINMETLLEYNNVEPVTGDSEKLLDQVADMLAFGAIVPCSECNGRQMLFHKSGYLCNKQLTEWVKCTNLVQQPKRTPCIIPKELYLPFMKDVHRKSETRAIRYIPPSANTIAKNVAVKKDEVDGPKVQRERPPLYNLTFAYIGLKDLEALKKRIAQMGGTCANKVTEKTIAVLSTAKEVQRMNSRMERVRELGIHVVPMEYLDAVQTNPTAAVSLINSMTLCDWGTDPHARIPQEEQKSKSKSIYTKSVPKSMKLKVKDGLAVDPDSGLEDVAHVYVDKKDKYNVVLGLTDIQRNKNSFYKLQLLESYQKNK